MEKKIYDFCFEYGYDTIMYDEFLEISDTIQLCTSDCSEPDDFWDEFGDDAEWDYDAYNAGMIAALKEISGKTYKIWTDGYRKFAYTGTKKEIQALNEKMWQQVDWNAVGLHF